MTDIYSTIYLLNAFTQPFTRVLKKALSKPVRSIDSMLELTVLLKTCWALDTFIFWKSVKSVSLEFKLGASLRSSNSLRAINAFRCFTEICLPSGVVMSYLQNADLRSLLKCGTSSMKYSLRPLTWRCSTKQVVCGLPLVVISKLFHIAWFAEPMSVVTLVTKSPCYWALCNKCDDRHGLMSWRMIGL